MKTIFDAQKIHVIADRPAEFPETAHNQIVGVKIPESCVIFNAPRPIYASFINPDGEIVDIQQTPRGMEYPASWEGDFLHGRFYAAVYAWDTRAIHENISLDAWVIIYHTMDEVIKWGREYCNTRKIDFGDFEPSDFMNSFLLRANRGEFNKETKDD